MMVWERKRRWKREDGGGEGNSVDIKGSDAAANSKNGYTSFSISKEIQLEEGVKNPSDEPFAGFDNIGAVGLALICASALAVLILLVVFVLWLRVRRKRQKLLHDLTFDDYGDEAKNSRSAPTSRSPSPKFHKRMSCPEALSATGGPRGMLVRSMTTGGVADFTLPPERVQPHGPREKSGSTSSQGSNSCSSPRTKNIGSIRPDLYHHPSFSEDDEPNLPETSHGRLWYSLLYNEAEELLIVTLIKVKDLPGRGPTNQPRDPFVKIFLLPDERTFRTSKVKKKTLSPVYNENHTFQVSVEDVKKRVLRFSVYDVDRRRVRHSCGHVMINLKNLDLTNGDIMWSDLEPMVQTSSSLGELQFSLVYLPSNEKIKVAIHSAKNISLADDYLDTVTYVRVQLYYGHKCHRVKKTISQQAAPNIFFNESLSFSVHGRQLDSCNMVLSVMLSSPRQASGASMEYGRITVGPFMYARGEELMHWQEMLAQSKSTITRWHPLASPAQHMS